MCKQNELGRCAELHALAEDSQSRIKDIQEKYLQRADEINQMLADQHRAEVGTMYVCVFVCVHVCVCTSIDWNLNVLWKDVENKLNGNSLKFREE